MTTFGKAVSNSFESFREYVFPRILFTIALIAIIVTLMFVVNDLLIDKALTNIVIEAIVFFISAIVLLSAFYYWKYDADAAESVAKGICSAIAVIVYVFIPFVLLNVIFKNIQLMLLDGREYVIDFNSMDPLSYIPPMASTIIVITFFLPFFFCALRNYCDTYHNRFSSLFNIKEIILIMYGDKGGIHIVSFLVGAVILGLTLLLAFLFQGLLIFIIPPLFLFFAAPIYPFYFIEWAR